MGVFKGLSIVLRFCTFFFKKSVHFLKKKVYIWFIILWYWFYFFKSIIIHGDYE